MTSSAGTSRQAEVEDAASASDGTADGTPSKRNKRKMTEPRRRTTDFSIRSICSNSDTEEPEPTATVDETGDERHRQMDRQTDKQDVLPTKRARESPLVIPSYIPTVSASNAFRFALSGTIHPSGMPALGMLPHFMPSALQLALDPRSCRTTPSTVVEPRAMLVQPSNLSNQSSEQPSVVQDPDDSLRTPLSHESPGSPGSSIMDDSSPYGLRRSRKNYKNMTKQRRIEANARERTRVHTISAAFESLRRAVPSYSYNQRLSKLAILRIACSYILALASLADLDYTEEKCAMTFGECVDLCTQTIQAEGKAKRKH